MPRRSIRTRFSDARSEPLERRVLLTGLTGQYFDRVDFTDLKLTRTDTTVNFNWGTAAPDASMAPDNFSVRWTGQVQPQYTQNYTFYVKSDDGARLWVDGRLMIDNWVNQSATEKSATIPLTAGQKYDIRLDYYDSTSTASAVLSWSSPSQAKQVIPATRLFPSSAGLDATYYDNQNFTGNSDSHIDTSVNFNWGTSSPDPAGNISSTTYSATWTGEIIPLYSQTYTFFVTADTGATTQLRVDRQLVFDSTSVQPAGEIQLEAGKEYDIQLSYAHSTGSANLKLEWSSPSQTRQVIPSAQLLASKLGSIPTVTPTYTNPVVNSNWPDPGVLFSDGYYWMTHTTGGPSNGWPLYKSTDLKTWTSVGNLLTSANRQSFMDDGAFWAPEIHEINGVYVLTGTARSTSYGDNTVIAIATAPEITGPYTVRSTPIVSSSTQGTLDSTIFQDSDGRVYLIWKEQSASGDAANGSIRMHELNTANFTTFATGSSEVTLLNNAGGGAWEKGIEEAPEMIRHGSYYYLFYSGSTIDTTYAVGVARATTLTGTYTRYPGQVPILQSNSTWGGPGHGAFIQDVDGTWWFYYHARHQNNPDFGRVQMLDKVIWTADGWPTFGNSGTPSVTAQVGPRIDAVSGTASYTFTGTSGNDLFRISRDSADTSLLDVQLNGTTVLSVPYAQIQNLTINPGAGSDSLLLDCSLGDCLPGSGITFAGSSADIIRLLGATASDIFHLSPGQISHGTGALFYTGATQIIVQEGTFLLDQDLNTTSFQAYGPGTSLLFSATPMHLGDLLLSSATAQFSATSNSLLSVTSLSIIGGGNLDLADDFLIINYTGASPSAAIRALLLSGHNGGAGITSSAANLSTEIGYAEASDLGLTTWDSQTVDSTTLLLKVVPAGDTNLDGRVDADDYARTDRGRAKNLSNWISGDFNYDGVINNADLAILDQSFAPTAAAAPVITPFISTPPITTETTPTTPPAPALYQIKTQILSKKAKTLTLFIKVKPNPKTGSHPAAKIAVYLATPYKKLLVLTKLVPTKGKSATTFQLLIQIPKSFAKKKWHLVTTATPKKTGTPRT
ncbi:MAG TPA: family 43 glycosylhydrolase [Tepidisphaeraceae bacterium]|jgi:GH43 family beta-xylosidase|nr:family 43 glycosylhydrolase [Tepidisphaeraceae bacterium]